MRALAENFSSATQALGSSWLRTALTTLGMIIGVGSVSLLTSIGLGVQQEVTEQVQSLGANLVFVVPGKLDKNSTPNPLALMGVSTLTTRDVEQLRTLPSVHRVSPLIFVGAAVDHEGQTRTSFVIASAASWFDMRPRPLAEGRVFTQSEENERVCVLAQAEREAIFGEHAAIGQTLMVQGVPFRVIGVLREEPASALFGGSGFENAVYLPSGAVQNAIPRVQINRIIVQSNPSVSPETVFDQISNALKGSHEGAEDFGVMTQKQVLGTIFRLMSIVTSLLTGLTSISLVVAGIGVMNIMLMTVTERTHEIGIRMAVGARRRDIFVQFLVEALVITLIGGILGLMTSSGICVLVRKYSPLHPIITPAVVAMAFGVCVAVGVVFGTAPAWRASRLHPIDSLRHE